MILFPQFWIKRPLFHLLKYLLHQHVFWRDGMSRHTHERLKGKLREDVQFTEVVHKLGHVNPVVNIKHNLLLNVNWSAILNNQPCELANAGVLVATKLLGAHYISESWQVNKISLHFIWQYSVQWNLSKQEIGEVHLLSISPLGAMSCIVVARHGQCVSGNFPAIHGLGSFYVKPPLGQMKIIRFVFRKQMQCVL